MDEMSGRDLKLRHIDRNGSATVQVHRVWDAERFMQARLRDLRTEVEADPSDKRPPGRVELVDDEVQQPKKRSKKS